MSKRKTCALLAAILLCYLFAMAVLYTDVRYAVFGVQNEELNILQGCQDITVTPVDVHLSATTHTFHFAHEKYSNKITFAGDIPLEMNFFLDLYLDPIKMSHVTGEHEVDGSISNYAIRGDFSSYATLEGNTLIFYLPLDTTKVDFSTQNDNRVEELVQYANANPTVHTTLGDDEGYLEVSSIDISAYNGEIQCSVSGYLSNSNQVVLNEIGDGSIQVEVDKLYRIEYHLNYFEALGFKKMLSAKQLTQ